MHVFVDESERRPYLIAAAYIAPAALARLRRELRGQLGTRERSIHFNKEQATRRKVLLAKWVALGDIQGRIYQARGKPQDARNACLRQLLDDIIAVGGTRLVIESREGRDIHDRTTIAQQRNTHPELHAITYDHMRPYEEPLLWVADGLAWAYGAGGDWRKQAMPLIEKVTQP